MQILSGLKMLNVQKKKTQNLSFHKGSWEKEERIGYSPFENRNAGSDLDVLLKEAFNWQSFY